MRPALVVALTLTLSWPADAGIGSALVKAARAGRVGTTAVKLSKGAKLARLAGGVSSVVVAERAAVALSGVAVDGAGYLARSSSGELLMIAKGSAAPMAVEDVAQAARRLGTNATVVLDPSLAASPDALKALPADVELFVSDGARQLPVRRVEQDGMATFIVEHGDTVVDLADFAVGLVPDTADEEDDERTGATTLATLIVAAVLLGAWLWKRRSSAA